MVKFFIFTSEKKKKICILHGRVFVMKNVFFLFPFVLPCVPMSILFFLFLFFFCFFFFFFFFFLIYQFCFENIII